MSSLAPSFSVTSFPDLREVHFTASGLWDMDTLVAYQRELIAAGRPMFESGKKMRVFGDLTGFVTQTREIAEGIRVIVTESARLGTERTAILSDSPLAAMQYKRINEGINAEIFEERDEAMAWLRAA
jgi:hypothetical protein